MLHRIALWWRSLRFFRYYVIADCNDNSITFSRKLYRHIELSSRIGKADERAQVFVFRSPTWDSYGFIVNPDLPFKTIVADIQYNAKYKTVGFESRCPSVNRIFYDYGLPSDRKLKLTVSVRSLPNGKLFYNIERPRP